MRCRSCNKNLTDAEASIKYPNWRDIPDPEERYVGLCLTNGCFQATGLEGCESNPLASGEEYEDTEEQEEEGED